MKTRAKYALGFAIAGFVIGPLLLAYATTHFKRGVPSGMQELLLILCPPSIGLMALDNAGKVEAVIGLVFISLENAILYGLLGLGIGSKIKKGYQQQ